MSRYGTESQHHHETPPLIALSTEGKEAEKEKPLSFTLRDVKPIAAVEKLYPQNTMLRTMT
jgi:hypothetical protein